MGAGKWIGGILGFMTMGPLGALAGFALGSLLDGNNGLFGNTYEKGQVEAGNYDEGQRNSFLFSMLVMASYIIRADGRIMHSEMEYVRQFLRMNFGEEAVIQGEQILLNLFEQRKQMVHYGKFRPSGRFGFRVLQWLPPKIYFQRKVRHRL